MAEVKCPVGAAYKAWVSGWTRNDVKRVSSSGEVDRRTTAKKDDTTIEYKAPSSFIFFLFSGSLSR